MAEHGELGQRKAVVLHTVVEEYVRTGEPVGSERIAERAGLGVSSATIRNEMAALEELGYLKHPHTSAGRIPTDTGYRHYVDSLPAHGRLQSASEEPIVRVELVDMGPSVMVLIIGQHGRVDKRVIDRPQDVDAATIADSEERARDLRGTTYADAQARLLQL